MATSKPVAPDGVVLVVLAVAVVGACLIADELDRRRALLGDGTVSLPAAFRRGMMAGREVVEKERANDDDAS